MGLPSLDELELNVTPGDKLSQQDPVTPREVLGSIPKPLLLDPPVPDIEEETPCNLLLPKSIDGELVVVAYGRAQPPREG